MSVSNTEFQDVPATVPGSVYNDLRNNHLMEDPFYRDNEIKARKLMDNDFTCCSSFSVQQSLLENDKVFLLCEGLDTMMYLYPGELGTLVYASQLLQAQAMQYAVEHWRRYRGRCMGAVIWQLNDCWPVASWASIDSFGRWKALHYYEKRFFAPVLISCHEEVLLSAPADVNQEFPTEVKSAHLNVSSETLNNFHGTAYRSFRRPDASVIEEGSFPVECPKLSAVWLPEQDFYQYDFSTTAITLTSLSVRQERPLDREVCRSASLSTLSSRILS